MTETAVSERSRPAEVLMLVIINLLAPLYLNATNGDHYLARMAAFETIRQYHPRNQVDLMAISQIIACGLTAMSSFGLALTENVSLSMAVRQRANGLALNRAVEQARRALRDARADQSQPRAPFVPDPNQAQYEKKVLAEVAASRQAAAAAMARFEAAKPPDAQASAPIATPAAVGTPAPLPLARATPPVTAKTVPTTPERGITDAEWQARWASAMVEVAQEFTDDIKNLPPAERELASRRAAILSTTANQLLSGNVPPRPKPGDLEIDT